MRLFKGRPLTSDCSECLHILSLGLPGLKCDANASIVTPLQVTGRLSGAVLILTENFYFVLVILSTKISFCFLLVFCNDLII